MGTAEHPEAVQKVVRKFAELTHPLWGWVVSILAIFIATLAADIIRIGCLVVAGGFAIYTFHNTKLISGQWKKTVWAVPVVAIACAGLFFGARYFDSDPTTSRSSPTQVQTQESPKARQEKDPDSITLHDLFQTDFDSVQQKSSGAVFVDDAKKIRVEYAIHTELNLRTKFLTFYIPSQQKTAEIGAYLAGQYNFILEKAPQLLVEQKNPGDSSTVSTKEAMFSNRIFVYHETYLPPEKTVELTKIYREHGVSVIFRSVDYLATRKLETKVRMIGAAPNVAQPKYPLPDH